MLSKTNDDPCKFLRYGSFQGPQMVVTTLDPSKDPYKDQIVKIMKDFLSADPKKFANTEKFVFSLTFMHEEHSYHFYYH